MNKNQVAKYFFKLVFLVWVKKKVQIGRAAGLARYLTKSADKSVAPCRVVDWASIHFTQVKPDILG